MNKCKSCVEKTEAAKKMARGVKYHKALSAGLTDNLRGGL